MSGSTPWKATNYDPFASLSSSKSPSPSLTQNPPRAQASKSSLAADEELFSSLLDPSFSSAGANGRMSLAEKRAAALKESEARASREQLKKDEESAVWHGLDMLGQRSSASTPSQSHQTPQVQQDDWLFSSSSKPQQATKQLHPSTSVLAEDDDWGLDDFANSSNPTTSSQKDNNKLLNGLVEAGDEADVFSLLGTKQAPSAPHQIDDTDDDILGMLGKPVDSIPKPKSPEPTVNSRRSQTSSQGRKGSPPPHIIGQIVEMGFSPDQARVALAATDTGIDVQQALDMLLSNGAGADDQPPVPTVRSDDNRRSERETQDRGEYDRDWPPSSRSRRPVQERASPSYSGSRRSAQTPTESPKELQDRADKLLAQASEIGLNMFNRANALFKDSKEKVQKAYEERAAKQRPTDGRPRWMQEAQSSSQSGTSGGLASGSFRDHDDETEHAIEEPQSRPKPLKADATQTRSAASLAPVSKPINLFDEEPTVYVSPARRRNAPQRSESQGHPATVSAAPVAPKRQATPARKTRKTVSTSTAAISTSNAHKTKGTEMYKLGQFAEAEKAYSSALSSLPPDHLLVIPILNNRAISRIKTGEYNGAIEDCTTVLNIIGADYDPNLEDKVTKEEEGASVDLSESLIKAYRRRAEAFEGREKWELAQKDWEAILRCGWTTIMRSDAQSGAARCRKAISAERDPPVPSKPKAPPPRPTATIVVQTEAVDRVREANRQQEEEERTKASLKDSVDTKLTAWKAGKETNIRALVASLENVLWPELQWQKVGLHELISPGQVKIRYMKAIAKLHPDKLNSGNTTVEQRMIANGVFSALNDAWLAFKQ